MGIGDRFLSWPSIVCVVVEIGRHRLSNFQQMNRLMNRGPEPSLSRSWGPAHIRNTATSLSLVFLFRFLPHLGSFLVLFFWFSSPSSKVRRSPTSPPPPFWFYSVFIPRRWKGMILISCFSSNNFFVSSSGFGYIWFLKCYLHYWILFVVSIYNIEIGIYLVFRTWFSFLSDLIVSVFTWEYCNIFERMYFSYLLTSGSLSNASFF